MSVAFCQGSSEKVFVYIFIDKNFFQKSGGLDLDRI